MSSTEKLVAIGASSVLALNAFMLLLDERFAIFPFVFGFDIRYVLTFVIVGIGAVASVVKKMFKK
ncbi:MAG TPA: hypothetical protein VGS11_11845 [Candidatus Bathyarchaeia archaeon]|nr:hypothetical protein [Candidatus Bathyarchaeia archaeon]